jgi:hypothetical protein
VTQRPGQDNLAMNAIRFLTTVAKSVHSKLFADPAALKQICEAIILPNLRVSPGGLGVRGRLVGRGGVCVWVCRSVCPCVRARKGPEMVCRQHHM